ncbi:MAG: MATE family efflux transporter [Lachnospiraceae bacterium]|nr:MATE family efflux transporter [Lachnospiraceae bacterium]
MSKNYLAMMRDGEKLSLREQVAMIVKLSIPAILAQISSIVMQYIDASMVGKLGANDSASIGLVASSTWLLGGLCMAAGTGFTVSIAKRCGAKDEKGARNLVKIGLLFVIIFSTILMIISALISGYLPAWLGGNENIRNGASLYFYIFALSLPFVQLNSTAAGMVQCSGNMKVPGILEIIMCFLDVIFNALFIFPSHTYNIYGIKIHMIGAGLGITGAAIGTALAEGLTALTLLYFLLFKSKTLKPRKNEKMNDIIEEIKNSVKISLPVALEQFITCSSYIAFTKIVSPLGTIALAAHSFSITAESLCYMPGYGIGAAATTIIGQSIGARRYDMTKKLGWLTTMSGVLVMTASGVVMYIIAPYMIGVLTPDPEIQALGTMVLRIEAFAEPLYAASIVATGVFRGAGDTIVPSVINLISMWFVRIPMAAVLAGKYGLKGVWIAMCFELCIRGTLFIILLGTRFKKRAEEGTYIDRKKEM